MTTASTTGPTSATTGRGRARPGAVLAVMCLAVFTVNVDTTIVNVTLPTLVAELGASTRDLQWIVDSYLLVFAALVLAGGSLSDRLGRRAALVAGLAVFGLGNAVAALADTPGQLIAARAFTGIGAALVFPTTLSILTQVFRSRAARARAIGQAALRRVLAEHTYTLRGAEVDAILHETAAAKRELAS